MAGKDRKIDPLTRDYVDDGAGSTEWTDTSQTAVYHQILGEAPGVTGGWAGDPAAGSRLHRISKKSTERGMHDAADAVREALAPLARDGLIRDISVEVTRDQHGKLVLAASAVDSQGGDIDVSPLLPWEA